MGHPTPKTEKIEELPETEVEETPSNVVDFAQARASAGTKEPLDWLSPLPIHAVFLTQDRNTKNTIDCVPYEIVYKEGGTTRLYSDFADAHRWVINIEFCKKYRMVRRLQ